MPTPALPPLSSRSREVKQRDTPPLLPRTLRAAPPPAPPVEGRALRLRSRTVITGARPVTRSSAVLDRPSNPAPRTAAAPTTASQPALPTSIRFRALSTPASPSTSTSSASSRTSPCSSLVPSPRFTASRGFPSTPSAAGPLGLYANLPPTSHGTPTINKLLLSSLSKGTWAGRTRVAKAFTARGTKDPLHSLDRLLEDRLASVAPITVTRDIGHLKWLLPRLLPSAQADPMVNLLQDIQRGVRVARILPLPRRRALRVASLLYYSTILHSRDVVRGFGPGR